MAVDFSLACSLSLFCFCSVRVFFSFRLDVVHTPHANFSFPEFPFVLALKVLLSEAVALSCWYPGGPVSRYSGLCGRRLSPRKRQQGYSTAPLPSVHRLVLHLLHFSRIPGLSTPSLPSKYLLFSLMTPRLNQLYLV